MEDYKEKYEKALKRAKEYTKNSTSTDPKTDYANDILKNIFPELKESEDERIRKGLIDFLKSPFVNENITDEKVTPWIAWLERQGGQNTNEIHPIFRVGDYIKNKKTSDKVLIEQLDIATKAYCYVSYDGGAEIHSDFSFSKQDEWMLIGQNIVEQKNAWSKEDEKMLQEAISSIIYACFNSSPIISWLKSLKERYTWKPSKEQIRAIEDAIKFLGCTKKVREDLKSLYEQLKKLREE